MWAMPFAYIVIFVVGLVFKTLGCVAEKLMLQQSEVNT